MRSALVELARWAADNRPIYDPVYVAITQGRQHAVSHYSSCGDLVHWLLYAIGAPANRHPWRVGVNISWLCGRPEARPCDPAERLEPGTILVLGRERDAHTCVVLADEGSIVRTADYGQPGGMLRSRASTVVRGERHLGTRPVYRVLDPLALPRGDVRPDEPLVCAHTAAPYLRGVMWGLAQQDVGELEIDGVAGPKTVARLARVGHERCVSECRKALGQSR